MTLIRMETESVNNLVTNTRTTASNLFSSCDDLVQMCRRMNWEGGSRDDFINQLITSQKQFNELFDNMDQLASELQQEMTQWIDVANSFEYRRSIPDSYILPIDPNLRFDWIQFLITGGDVGADIWGNLAKLGKYTKWIPVINIILGIWEDKRAGDSWARAIVSELVEAGLHLTPLGLYGLAHSLTQLGFSMYGGVSGNLEYSAAALEFLEKFDFTEKFGDAVYDFAIQNPASFVNYLINPAAIFTDPNISKFFETFITDNMRDFGWEQGAVWVENMYEFQYEIMVPIQNVTSLYQF